MDPSCESYHPLAINLQRQTQHLASLVPPESPCITNLYTSSNTREFLTTLSKLLANPSYTQIVATLFRPILMDLCARWIEDDVDIEENLVALCLLLEVHEELFPILSRLLQKYFPQGPLNFILNVSSPLEIDVSRLHRLLLAYYRILQANRQLPYQRYWSPAPLSKLIWTPSLDSAIRLLSMKCYSMQTGMGEVESEKLEEEIFGEICAVECPLEYGRNADGSMKHMDGWILENVEIDRVRAERNKLVTEVIDFYSRDEGAQGALIEESDLSPYIANIEGVLLLKASSEISNSPAYIPTPSGNEALRSLAHHISLRLPTLFTSAPSAGKALILHHLASLLYPGRKNQIITIHLADTSLDPRALLGSYVSSTTRPGSFEWKEGVLVRSMREGKWIVLEDVDRGSNEVLGTLKPLVESLRAGKWIGGRASIYVPGRGEVEAHDDFMLFATRSVSALPTGKFPHPTFFGAHKFYETALRSPSIDELRTIIGQQFPRLTGSIAQASICMWSSVKALRPAASSREIGLRELIKFCQRLDKLLPPSYHAMEVGLDDEYLTLASVFSNPTLREVIYLEARDVFFGAGTLTASALACTEAIAGLIAQHLGLDSERYNWLINQRTPDFQIEKDVNGTATGLQIGSTYLPARKSKIDLRERSSRPFALHQPAVCLLSRIATAVSLNEPILLTGETGTGKTSAITYLASLLRRPLVSLNLSHQTESADLIGGLKPVDARVPGSSLQERFVELFGVTFSRKKNEKFEIEVRKAVNEAKWKRAVGLWKESVRMAQGRLKAKQDDLQSQDADRDAEVNTPRKRRKLDQNHVKVSLNKWNDFLREVEEFEVQHVHGKGKFAFGFVEGPLVKALRSGDWVLLDEINLASPETLECITSLLHGPTASITLTEHGELEPVPRHTDFRLFACMNPATDVGKKDLPPNIRSRFTEIDVPPPDADKETLLSIVAQYIGSHAIGDKGVVMNIAEFYMAVKDLCEKRLLADGSNHRPHFSMRTLARALTFASDIASTYSLRRAIWEGCLMAFTMVLDEQSSQLVTALAHKHLLAGVRNPRSMLAKEPSPPANQDNFLKLGPFYLEKGPLPEDPVEDYIMTASVEKKLIDLARIILTRKFPVLIEGPTSSGKTSSIEYLAKRTGNDFIRINNHEHTDIQEYIGSYISDPVTGKLVFRDGLLVQALRKGSWIVLDELNLAPTDVLEALNRLLDDNRELVIPETHEVVRPHPHFMLFATQNPPGLYAGRKVLSRAFRNRFLEVHFDDVPQAELETILCQRCRIAPSYGKKIVAVFRELQKHRESSRVFESKQGFATLRDLFRWAGRDAVGYQELAENGYMLLAERARRNDDKLAVKGVIESVMGVRIDETHLYELDRPGVDVASFLGCTPPSTSDVIWTKAMQRLFVLLSRALRFKEPVLLVGETGAGKTSVCQLFADAAGQKMQSLNCHQNTETADIIGGLRPVRNRHVLQADTIHEAITILNTLNVCDADADPRSIPALVDQILQTHPELDGASRSQLEAIRSKLRRAQSIFEWYDGPLIEAMRNGDVFLLDEISLAEDSVLERLNSVLEPERSIVLAERGGSDAEKPVISASSPFKLVATMNPGGDYGKKELSPALRNRFTEIWVPRVDDRTDLELIINSLWKSQELLSYTSPILDFVDWLCTRVGDRSLMSLRDILAWVTFTNSVYCTSQEGALNADELFHNAAHMTFLDGLGSLPQLSGYSRESVLKLRNESMQQLESMVPLTSKGSMPTHDSDSYIQLGAFAMKIGNRQPKPQLFTLSAPTTQSNAMRIVRACQVAKPVLLEGSPGVGKTSLVSALANITGNELHRINLSDQTDLVDLFGSDLPVEGGRPGEFAWRDGEFLQALQLGHWVLLDEMNLAPQAVLEGLNAVLDHRGTVYIPELGRSFTCHPSFRIFAAQNPLQQGGGRKGLPKSFVNRFTKVYIEELTVEDYFIVCRHLSPDLDEDTLRAMILFNKELNDQVVVRKVFGREGSPWEFNLRDIIRWGSLSTAQYHRQPASYVGTIYLQRFRTAKDRSFAQSIFDSVFGESSIDSQPSSPFTVSKSTLQIGHFSCDRQNLSPLKRSGRILKAQLPALESLGNCISRSWLAIIVGNRNSGKTEVVRALASLSGNVLQEIPINSATDTMDILGSFEQLDVRGQAADLLDSTIVLLEADATSVTGSRFSPHIQQTGHRLRLLRENLDQQHIKQQLEEAKRLLNKLAQSDSQSNCEYASFCHQVDTLLMRAENVGRFEWVDGPLVKAMKLGHWVLLDGANLCSASVLDRLNSLCESDGFLVLSERGFIGGQVQTIKPHENFRLFMSVDPQYGELSRAMRNRGIEVTLFETPQQSDSSAIQDHLRLPAADQFEPASSITKFDSIRRGNPLQNAGPVNGAHSSLGLIQSSSISLSLSDQIFILSLATAKPWEFAVPFIFRTVIPATCRFLARYLPATDLDTRSITPRLHNLLQEAPRPRTTAALHQFRQALSLQSGLPLEFLYSKPMDFFLAMPSDHSNLVDDNLPLAHAALFHYLELGSATLMFNNDEIPTLQPESSVAQSNRSMLREIEGVLSSLQIVVSELLESYQNDPVANMIHAQTGVKLLSYAMYLRRLSQANVFDFSKAQAVIRWFSDALSDCPPVFSPVSGRIHDIKKLLSLTAGFGLIEIWQAFYAHLSEHVRTNIERYGRLSCCFSDDAPNVVAIRRQILDVLSIAALPATSQTPTSLPDLWSRLDECILGSEVLEPDVASHLLRAEPQYLALELSPLAHWRDGMAEKASENLKTIIDMICARKRSPVSRLIPYQQLVWSLGNGSEFLTSLTLGTISWLESIWHVESSITILQGPSFLHLPVHLLQVVASCSPIRIPLRSLREHTEELDNQCQTLRLQCQEQRPRSEILEMFFFQNLTLIMSCFSTSFTAEQLSAFSVLRDQSGSLPDQVQILQQSSNSHFNDLVREFLQPLCIGFHRRSLGYAWIALSRMTFALIVPNIPIDPASIQNATYSRLEREGESLLSQISLHSQLELLLTGCSTNELIRYMEFRLKNIRAELAHLPTTIPREDVSRLHHFWAEVAQFLAAILNPSKIGNLLELLHSKDPNAPLQEQVLQESLNGFQQRLDTLYSEFSDIVTPIKLALLQFRLGLRLLVATPPVEHLPDSIHNRLIPAIVSFPSMSSSSQVLATVDQMSELGTNVFQGILLSLSGLASEASSGVDVGSRAGLLELLYEQASGLWNIDQAKERDGEAALGTLYRRSNLDHQATSDAEIEEAEFLSLFPSYEDTLEDTKHRQETQNSKSSQSPSHLVPPLDMALFVDIHFHLMTPKTSLTGCHFENFRKATLELLVQADPSSLSDSLDPTSLPFQFSLLHKECALLKQNRTEARTLPNFYTSSNIPEVGKAIAVLIALRDRLKTLSLEWPDQVVLHHLSDRCDQVLDLDLRSPVAKILSALEQLLVQTEDWEMYANRENSLRAHRDALIALIVDWRRLELASWNSLLESESKRFKENCAVWWFRLYDAVVRGVSKAVDEEISGEDLAVTKYLEGLIPLLNDFLASSPLGEFHTRMQLLWSFSQYLATLSGIKEGSSKVTLERVQNVLLSTYQYFEVFSSKLALHMSEGRNVLETEIKKFIKLASWKDINVLALKQSAQRSHHQLYKIVRKFRELLNKPISNQISPQFLGEQHLQPLLPPTFTRTSTRLANPEDSQDGSSGHIQRLRCTFSKFEHLIQQNIRPRIQSSPFQLLDDLTSEIVSSSQRLSSMAIPATVIKEKREKYLKSIHAQKRKAWSDLLKELKRVGFTYHVKPDVLRQNADELWIKEQPPLQRLDGSIGAVDRVNKYFMSLQACLPVLRSSLSSHHPDLSTRDLSRAVAFAECVFSHAIDHRYKLSQSYNTLSKFRLLSKRLRAVESSQLHFYDEDISPYISRSNDLMCRLSNALSELQSALQEFHLPDKNGEGYRKVVGILDHLTIRTNDLQGPLAELDKAIRGPGFICLTDGEGILATSVLEHLNVVNQNLATWTTNLPDLSHFFDPFRQWLQSEMEPIVSLPAPNSDSNSVIGNATLEAIINTFLVPIQSLSSLWDKKTEVEDNDEDLQITTELGDVRRTAHILNIDGVYSRLEVTLGHIRSSSGATEIIPRILPFLEVYLTLVEDHISIHTYWTKSLFKLDYVLCSIIQTVASKGFCKPPEETGEDGGDEVAETGAGGVGLGEGTGKENVSKEIEDESQVEGLQGDEQDSEDQPEKGGDQDALEMNEEFGGDLQDVPENESDDDDDANSDTSSSPDLDERLENLDPSDPNAIDEKLWGDESGPEDEGGEGETNEDHAKEQGGESEVVAKDGKQRKPPKENEPKAREDGEEPSLDEEEVDMQEPQEGEEDKDPNVSGAPIDEYVPDANTLDLPDDMDLGEVDAGEDATMEDDLEDDLDAMEESIEDDGPPGEAEQEQNDDKDVTDDNPQEDASTEDPNHDVDAISRETEDAEAQKENKEEEPEAGITAKPDVSSGDGTADSRETANQATNDANSNGQEGTSDSAEGQASASTERMANEDGSSKAEQQPDPRNVDSEAGGTAASGAQEGSKPSQSEVKQLPNPLRSLGDAMKEIQHRFEEILNAQENESSRPKAANVDSQSQQLEYLHPDDEDEEMQALAPAEEQQIARLDELQFTQDDTQNGEVPMDVDVPDVRVDEPEQSSAEQFSPPDRGSSNAQQSDMEGAVLQYGPPSSSSLLLPPDSSMPKAESEQAELDRTVEDELRSWRAADYPDEGAEHIWRQYESLTHDLAYALCEQLRLILEPTLATRLKGDYRTGKRLNMKKVISYIASDYTKDKIWMRRTKPSQREYQVLIAIDDSRSMAESHSIHLAYETLALIGKALNRLESGDIAVAKFGEEVDLLHGFDEGPFTDQAGTKVINAFRFKQKATNVLSLLESSLRILENARERRAVGSSSAADLWQLEIIISDGMCQDHEKLRTALRRAEERRIMVVFIILDSLHTSLPTGASASGPGDASGRSIMNMDKAEFKNVDGRMELQLQKYLDSFPFEYYVVLRNVEALPDVLASTLKQFFERIAEE